VPGMVAARTRADPALVKALCSAAGC
jgi:hypothetical protein